MFGNALMEVSGFTYSDVLKSLVNALSSVKALLSSLAYV